MSFGDVFLILTFLFVGLASARPSSGSRRSHRAGGGGHRRPAGSALQEIVQRALDGGRSLLPGGEAAAQTTDLILEFRRRNRVAEVGRLLRTGFQARAKQAAEVLAGLLGSAGGPSWPSSRSSAMLPPNRPKAAKGRNGPRRIRFRPGRAR